MNPLNLLTEKDKEKFYRYVRMFAYCNVDEVANTPQTDADTLLRVWDREKDSYLTQFLGGNLILEKEVQFEKSEDDLCDAIHASCMSGEMQYFYHKFYRYFNAGWDTPNEEAIWKDACQSLVYSGILCANVYHGKTVVVPLPNGKKMTLQSGCKVMKTIGKLAEAFGIDGFEEFRLAHSMILNNKASKGTLCLSIHPMDYVTMSDNAHGWSSCMNWTRPDGGEFRRGTVEMLNSPNVVVAYLKSDSEKFYFEGYSKDEEYEWNSKKWRTLMVIDHDIITTIKSYPTYNPTLHEACVEWARELAETNLKWKYEGTGAIKHSTGNDFINDNGVAIWFTSNTMYNDFGCGDSHYIMSENADGGDICYSGADMCMHCGETDRYYDHEGMVVCDCCSRTMRCAECGDRLYDDETYEVEGRTICQYCYDNHAQECPECETSYFHDNMHHFAVIYNDKLYKGDLRSVCPDCLRKTLEKHSGKVHKVEVTRGWRIETYYAVKFEDLDDFEEMLDNGWCNVEEVRNYIKAHGYGYDFKYVEPISFN